MSFSLLDINDIARIISPFNYVMMLHNQKFDVIHHNEVFKIPLKAIIAKDQRLFTQQVTRMMLSLDFSSCSQYALPVFH